MKLIWSSSSGRIELDLTIEQISKGYHTGQCDADIAELRHHPKIASQLVLLKPKLVASELKEYGAWDDVELLDHENNLDRLLWIACGDLIEEESEND